LRRRFSTRDSRGDAYAALRAFRTPRNKHAVKNTLYAAHQSAWRSSSSHVALYAAIVSASLTLSSHLIALPSYLREISLRALLTLHLSSEQLPSVHMTHLLPPRDLAPRDCLHFDGIACHAYPPLPRTKRNQIKSCSYRLVKMHGRRHL